MVEVLVFSLCISTPTNSCNHALEALYYEKELNLIANRLEKRYSDYFLFLNAIKVINEKQVVIPVTNVVSVQFAPDKNNILINHNF